MTGQILSIPQALPNMTYTLQFIGPALRCDYADNALINEVYDSYRSMYNDTDNSPGDLFFVAWAPSSSRKRGDISFLWSDDTLDHLDGSSIDSAHLYVIPNSSTATPASYYGTQDGSDDIHYGYQDLLDCKLHNASYETFFNFTFPDQSIDIRSRKLINPVRLSDGMSSSVTAIEDLDARKVKTICYQTIMASFGRILAGYAVPLYTYKTTWCLTAIDWTTRGTAQSGLEQLFQNITLSMLATPSLT